MQTRRTKRLFGAVVVSVSLLAAGVFSPESAAAESDGNSRAEGRSLEISTDRPGAADGSSVVATGHSQVETGTNAAFGPSGIQVNLFDTLLRYGITENLEARLFTSPLGLSTGASTGGVRALGNLTLAAKINWRLGDGATAAAIPFVALDRTLTPERSWSGGVRLVADIGTNRPVGMTFNLGWAAVERQGAPVGGEVFGSVVGNASLTDTVGSFVEVYTVAPPASEVDVFVDAGATLAVTDRFQLDGWIGLEVADPGTEMFGIGASYLL